MLAGGMVTDVSNRGHFFAWNCGAVKHSTDIEEMYIRLPFSDSYSAAQSLREWTWLNTGLDSPRGLFGTYIECLLSVFWTPWALLKMVDTNDPPKCVCFSQAWRCLFRSTVLLCVWIWTHKSYGSSSSLHLTVSFPETWQTSLWIFERHPISTRTAVLPHHFGWNGCLLHQWRAGPGQVRLAQSRCGAILFDERRDDGGVWKWGIYPQITIEQKEIVMSHMHGNKGVP